MLSSASAHAASYLPGEACTLQGLGTVANTDGKYTGSVDNSGNCCINSELVNILGGSYCQACNTTVGGLSPLLGAPDQSATTECQTSDSILSINPLIPCSNSAYASQNSAVCTCEYYVPNPANPLSGVYNGNTYTAFGCMPADVGSLVNIIISICIGLGGVVALIMMIIGGYKIMTNPGDAEEIGDGKGYITRAILGLLLIIFCVIILKIIGIDVLGINALTNLIG